MYEIIVTVDVIDVDTVPLICASRGNMTLVSRDCIEVAVVVDADTVVCIRIEYVVVHAYVSCYVIVITEPPQEYPLACVPVCAVSDNIVIISVGQANPTVGITIT